MTTAVRWSLRCGTRFGRRRRCSSSSIAHVLVLPTLSTDVFAAVIRRAYKHDDGRLQLYGPLCVVEDEMRPIVEALHRHGRFSWSAVFVKVLFEHAADQLITSDGRNGIIDLAAILRYALDAGTPAVVFRALPLWFDALGRRFAAMNDPGPVSRPAVRSIIRALAELFAVPNYLTSQKVLDIGLAWMRVVARFAIETLIASDLADDVCLRVLGKWPIELTTLVDIASKQCQRMQLSFARRCAFLLAECDVQPGITQAWVDDVLARRACLDSLKVFLALPGMQCTNNTLLQFMGNVFSSSEDWQGLINAHPTHLDRSSASGMFEIVAAMFTGRGEAAARFLERNGFARRP